MTMLKKIDRWMSVLVFVVMTFGAFYCIAGYVFNWPLSRIVWIGANGGCLATARFALKTML